MYSHFLRRMALSPLKTNYFLVLRRFYESSDQLPIEGDSYSDWSQPRVRKQADTPFAEVRNAYRSGPIPSDAFVGISNQPLSKDILAILHKPPDSSEINIRRLDGGLYISADFYQKLLNKAVGVGGWSIIPISEPSFLQNQEGARVLIREFGFYILGRFISIGIGEGPWYTGIGLKTGIVSAYEVAKRDALTMCCKELGMALNLYDEEFVNNWRNKYAERKMCENIVTKATKALWVKRDSSTLISYPWRISSSFSFTNN